MAINIVRFLVFSLSFLVVFCVAVRPKIVVNNTSIIIGQHLVVEAKSPTAAVVKILSDEVGPENMVNNQNSVVKAENPMVSVTISWIASKTGKHKVLSGIIAVVVVVLLGFLVKGFRCSSPLELTESQVPQAHAPVAPVQAQPIGPAQAPIRPVQECSISFPGIVSRNENENENVAVAGDYSNGISAFMQEMP